MQYSESISTTKRWKTREVLVGNVGVGGDNPIRIQSMTTSPTHDVKATVELIKRNIDIPIVADIHFFPRAAMQVVDFVDKVRINPGNFVDRRASFKVIDYDDASYALEIEKIEETFTPLVEKCKRLKRSMRIGTNHGSLSDRIMSRYGDTPKGMVESAFEFLRVAIKLGYHDIIFSMKASNPLVMVQAYRLLVAEMMKNGWNYPLHLGVTEAGLGEDGRVKSAMGIGSLLLDGLGDTIRVSLTEDPWYEIDPCKRLISFAESYQNVGISEFNETFRKIDSLDKRKIDIPKNVTLHPLGSALPFDDTTPIQSSLESRFSIVNKSYALEVTTNFNEILSSSPSYLVLNLTHQPFHLARKLSQFLQEHKIDLPLILKKSYPHLSFDDLVIQSAAELGSLLADQIGDGIFIEAPFPEETLKNLSFSILQAARLRSTKTDFISCPSCGRTLFDLQDVTKRIRDQTHHLPGVKIAIMGCIVNGPGEMADADFGYVGSKTGMVDLYVGKTCVQKDIPFADADLELISLIKSHGRWIEPVLI
jgi:(E)-4-hydroxy-3-methylbut-2-enyl-diphosphate synthase